MRKFVSTFLIVLVVSFLHPQEARAELSARTKAAITIVGYGTAGGALMGAASMAFGTSTRAVAQGASLGLYAGIIFASYVLISHHQRSRGTYDSDNTIYRDSNDIYGDEYGAEDGGSSEGRRGGFFNRFESVHSQFAPKEKGGSLPPLQVNLFQMSF